MSAVDNPQLVARREEVVETIHGVEIRDLYRWLEASDSSETQAWTDAQNGRTDRILQAVSGRAALENRLRDLLQVGTVGSAELRGDRVFYMRREGDQAQPVLLVRENGTDRVLIDPNTLDASGLTALDWWRPSHDGTLLAFGTSQRGDEWSVLQVLDVATSELQPDRIERARYSSVAWLPDNSGFFYTRYPEPGTVPPGQEHYNSHAFFHRLGADPKQDPKVFGEGRSPQDIIDLAISRDGRWLVASAFKGWTQNDLYLRDLASPDSAFQPIVENLPGIFTSPELDGDRLYLRTNWQSPNYRIVTLDLPGDLGSHPDAWQTLVAERPNRVIDGFILAGGRIVAEELESATSRLRTYAFDGTAGRELELPTLGSLAGITGEPESEIVVAGFTSFAIPPRLLAFDLSTGQRSVFAALPPAPGVDPDQIAVEQVHYPSKDGTSISMFLVHRKNLEPNGDLPTLLTGYGGFNISRTPAYLTSLIAWIERGGLYALPNLRGGGEYGEAWHRAGMLGNKQNVFDDFLGAAEWLIAQGYTRPERLGIAGGSNGGLLMGAAFTQRPDLFKAVYCAVPLLDMLRYQEFSIAKLWIPEYGSAEDPDAFTWLYAYSPYHHVQNDAAYPAVFFTTAEADSRVDPLHARKMAALMQSIVGFDEQRPILLHVERDAGHGVGKPLAKRVAEAADQLSFFTWQLERS